MGVKSKLSVAEKLCNQLNISMKEVAYIGDDLNDIHLLKEVGLSAAPSNAAQYIKDIVKWKLDVKGGDGAFRAFVERYLNERGKLNDAIDLFLKTVISFKQ